MQTDPSPWFRRIDGRVFGVLALILMAAALVDVAGAATAVKASPAPMVVGATAYTLSDMASSVMAYRPYFLPVTLLFPVWFALLAFGLKMVNARGVSLFVADLGIFLALLTLAIEGAGLAYYIWVLGRDPVKEVDILFILAPIYLVAATVGLIKLVHPLGQLAVIQRLSALFGLLVVCFVGVFLLMKMNLYVVFFGNAVWLLLVFVAMIALAIWYFKKFLSGNQSGYEQLTDRLAERTSTWR
jgi:hypothetical protein